MIFASLRDLISTQPTPHEVRLARQSVYFPSLHIDNEVIWGLTARILISLFQYGLNVDKHWPFLLNSPAFKAQYLDRFRQK